MISRLAIAGYRSFRDVTLELEPLNVVTGANGSGKSSLYRALRLLVDSSVRAYAQRRFYDHFRSDVGAPARQRQIDIYTPVLAAMADRGQSGVDRIGHTDFSGYLATRLSLRQGRGAAASRRDGRCVGATCYPTTRRGQTI